MKKNVYLLVMVLAFYAVLPGGVYAHENTEAALTGDQFFLTTESFDESVADDLDLSSEKAKSNYQKQNKKKAKKNKKEPIPVYMPGEYNLSFDKDDIILEDQTEESSDTDADYTALNGNEERSSAAEKDEEKEKPKERIVVGKMFLYGDKDKEGKPIIKGCILIKDSSPMYFYVETGYARRTVEKNALWGIFQRDEKTGEPFWPDTVITKGQNFYLDQLRIYPKKAGFLQGEFYSMNAGQARQSAFTAIK